MTETTKPYVRVRYVKSAIGYNQRQKDTIRSLGLRKLGDEVIQPANGAILGMCRAVQHLVEWEEVEGAQQ
ncbi:MAG: 50S ribosomal protein L30 [Ardenticatenaceae bacterium]|nr:50S ribosomal protein L30 [Ardenticatenaceae bacterium]